MPEQFKTVEDFAASESFQNWVNKANRTDTEYWETWIKAHPHQLQMVEAATTMIRLMQSLRKKEVAHKKKHLIIEDLRNRLNNEHAAPVVPIRSRTHRPRIAAAAILFLTLGTLGYLFLPQRTQSKINTEYGENKAFSLPDGSQVSLNANSDLIVNKSWDDQSTREVWLDGEAFFSIRHTASHQRFIVHTDNGDVEVLGTQFNVYNRRGKTQVVLTSGKVKVISRNALDTVYLEPGQMVELTAMEVKEKQKVDVARFTAWKRNTLSFDDTPLRDVATLIKDNYGYEIVWSDEKIKSVRFTYQLVGNDLDLLLATLSEALDLDIRKKDNLIYISSK